MIVDLERTIVELAPRVLRYAQARLGDPALAEDVAQESLAALMRACRNDGASDSAEAFVFAIARRRAARASWRQRLWVPLDSVVGARATAPTPEAQAVVDAFRRELPPGLRFENAPLAEVGRRLSDVLGMAVRLTCRDPSVTTLTMDFSGLTLQSALQQIGDREERPKASWQLIVGPAPGAKAPQIAVAVGPAKKKTK